MAADHTKIEGTEVLLADLKTNRDKRIDDLAILSIIDFFVIRSPRVRQNAKRSSAQTVVLSEHNWSLDMVESTIASTLFDEGMKFCRNPSSFASEVRNRKLYLDERIKDVRAQAFLLQNGEWRERKGGDRYFNEQETKPDCFFRHLRNGMAHGLIYKLPYGKCAFMDRESGNKGKLTAYIVTTIGRLEKLKSILLNSPRGRKK